MAEQNTVVFDQADIDSNKTMAILMAIFPILFFLPLVDKDKMGQSPMLKFFANQALLIFLANLAVFILSVIPYIQILGGIIGLVVFVFWILLLVSACKGEGKPLPLIGGIQILK